MRMRWMAMAATGVLIALAGAGPARGATSLIAAYDTYVSGKGFQIGLVDLGTGAPITVPAGVNTAADELHPALSADGRYLVFSRMQLQPQLNGNVIPPADRTVELVDRVTGALTTLEADGAGPTVNPRSNGQDTLAVGHRPRAGAADPAGLPGVKVGRLAPPTFASTLGDDLAQSQLALVSGLLGSGDLIDLPHASALLGSSAGRLRAYTVARFDAATGTPVDSRVVVDTRQPNGPGDAPARVFGSAIAPAGHVALRAGDGYAAFEQDVRRGRLTHGDIKSILLASQASADAAPDPIDTDADERMPAWGPDGTTLAFVRTNGATGVRSLLVYDLTAGLQTVVNPGIALGAATPSRALRRFHEVWGGIALALSAVLPGAANVACGAACAAALGGARVGAATGAALSPAVAGASAGAGAGGTAGAGAGGSIGIVVARVTGSRRVLGRRVPRLRALGRVPLGAAVLGTNRFRWNFRVGGRRLTPGTYVLTFRLLTRSGRIRSTSRSVQFRVTAAGRVVSPRLLRG
ncbi:MAG: hypothetical protein U0R70_00845 [Solirubrobacteraceae bacterium]